jgi:hypothetical protein
MDQCVSGVVIPGAFDGPPSGEGIPSQSELDELAEAIVLSAIDFRLPVLAAGGKDRVVTQQHALAYIYLQGMSGVGGNLGDAVGRFESMHEVLSKVLEERLSDPRRSELQLSSLPDDQRRLIQKLCRISDRGAVAAVDAISRAWLLWEIEALRVRLHYAKKGHALVRRYLRSRYAY